ncbi:hypothetical protein [Ornithinimicrobium sp. Y1694]|uniref:hypothetical protein n=1 Tax=Ornithinimicrobium sp. Y1694 TaxID=3418590 RepID=UPI003CEA4AD0
MSLRPSRDRSGDPSPFAWIFGGALALVGLGAVIRSAVRDRSGGDVAEGGTRKRTDPSGRAGGAHT